MIKKRNSNFKFDLLFWLIVGLALLVRLYRVDNPIADWHSFRQSDTASVTRNYIKNGWDLFHPRYDDLSNIQSGVDNPHGWRMVELPVFNSIHLGVYVLVSKLHLDGTPIFNRNLDMVAFSGRLVSILSSLILLFFLYGLVKFVSGRGIALLTGAFFAVLPFSVFYSRTVLPDMMAVMWAVGSLYWLIDPTKHIEDWKGLLFSKNTWHKMWRNFLLSAIFAALALLTKPSSVFLLIPLLLFWGINFNFHKKLNWILLLIYAFLILFPLWWWRGWIQQFPEGIPAWKWLLWGEIKPFQPAWWRWLFYERIGNLILGGWGTLFLVLGLLAKKGKREFWFYFSWLIGIGLYLVVFASGNVRHDYYQIILIPLLCVLMAKGVFILWQDKTFKTWIKLPVIFFVVSISLLMSWYQIKGYYQINNPAIIEAGMQANHLLPHDAKVIAPYFGDTTFLYQINRQGWPLVTNYPIQEMINKGAEYYVSVNYDEFTKKLMDVYQVVNQTDDYIIINLQKTN